MKKVLCFALFFILAACHTKPALVTDQVTTAVKPTPVPIAAHLTAIEIERGAFVISHEFPIAQANSMVVEMSPTDLLISDAPWTSAATRELLKWTKEKFGERKITAINTHSHMDRIAGNEVFLSHASEVYSSDLTIKYVNKSKATELVTMAKRVEAAELKAEFKKMKIKEANNSFPLKEGKVLQFGDTKAEIFYPGHGHTKDNVVVYLPERKILFGGCFIVGLPKLGYIKEANLKEWPKALDRLNRFDAKWVIPGHGHSYSPDLIEHTKYLVR